MCFPPTKEFEFPVVLRDEGSTILREAISFQDGQATKESLAVVEGHNWKELVKWLVLVAVMEGGTSEDVCQDSAVGARLE